MHRWLLCSAMFSIKLKFDHSVELDHETPSNTGLFAFEILL